MSSTNRGTDRQPFDTYNTPSWCVRRLLEAVKLPSGLWLEPSAGDGAIIRAVRSMRDDVTFDAVEIRGNMKPELEKVAQGVYIDDFLALPEPNEGDGGYAVVITNPPYSQALDFVKKAMCYSDVVVMLLRLNFWGSGEKAGRPEFMRDFPADTYVFPNRPSFVGGKNDSTEYAWLVWSRESIERGAGLIRELASTSLEERKKG